MVFTIILSFVKVDPFVHFEVTDDDDDDDDDGHKNKLLVFEK